MKKDTMVQIRIASLKKVLFEDDLHIIIKKMNPSLETSRCFIYLDIMLKLILEKITNASFREAEFLSYLPIKDRLKGFLGLLSFTFIIMVLTQLSFHPYYAQSRIADNFIIIQHLIIFFIFNFTYLPFMIPKLKPYRFIFLGLGLGLGIYWGIAIGGNIDGGKVFQKKVPDHVLILWFLSLVALTIGLYIYGNLIKKISHSKAEMETEISLANRIQKKISPEINEIFQKAQIYGNIASANEIGGDFIDCFHISDHKLFIAVGDVSGHNITAGLLMAIVKGALRTELNYFNHLETLMESLNTTIFQNSDTRMFITMSCGIFDFNNRILKIANAGHPPLLVWNRTQKELKKRNPRGIALGMTSQSKYQTESVPINNDDIYIFLTDGFIEAKSPQGDEFSIDGIQEFLNLNDFHDPKDLFYKTNSELQEFTKKKQLEDDTSMLAIMMTE